MAKDTRELQRFLLNALYRHPQVQRTTERARSVVSELFVAYLAEPDEMPVEHAQYAAGDDRHRAVADYVAGMTDRFAAREHQRLTGCDVFSIGAA